jgi:signal transduction histidine kinase
MRMNLDYLEEQLRRASQREVSQLSSLGVTDLLNVVFELRRGTRLIEELSHDAETGADAEADWTDLRFSLLSAVRTARVEIPERVNVVTDFGHTHRARGRATRLEYAFLTLILNAARAVRDHTECPTIRVATRNLGADRLLAIVSDTGPGIHPAELERIFDPFFEAQDGSAGFGFCICQKLVAEAGGEIWVESEVGRGTRFGIELLTVPADKADLDTLRPLPQPFVVAEAPRRIFRKSNY